MKQWPGCQVGGRLYTINFSFRDDTYSIFLTNARLMI